MNKKELEAINNATKISKNIAELYKTILPETNYTTNGAASLIKRMQPNLGFMNNQTIKNIFDNTQASIPNLASESVARNFKGAEMFYPVKQSMSGFGMEGATTLLKEMQTKLVGTVNPTFVNMLNTSKVNVPNMATECAASLLKQAPPSLAENTNQAIINLIKGAKASVLAGSEAKTSAAIIDPSLTGNAFKSVANLLNGINKDTLSIYESASSISKGEQLSFTERALQEVNSKFNGMNKNELGVSNSAIISSVKSLESVIRGYDESTRLSMEGMASIVKSLQKYQKSIADLCQITEEEVMESMEMLDEEEQQEPQTQNQPLFTNEEFNEALDECINDKKTFKKRSDNWSKKKKKLFTNLIKILGIFIQIFIMPYLQENVGLPVTTQVVSTVKEFPEKASKIVGTLKKGVEAIIVENQNYYYKVSFKDENGEEKEGYVAKRNVKIIEESETEEIEKEE